MKAIFSVEKALKAFEGKHLSWRELAAALGCGQNTAENLIKKLREAKKLVIHTYYPPETDHGKGRSAPVYKLRKHHLERDVRRPTIGKNSTQRKAVTLQRKLNDLKEERYIALCESQTEEGRAKVNAHFDQLERDVKHEPKEMQRVYDKRRSAKKAVANPKLLVERQPSLAMCWSTPIKSDDTEE